MPQYNRRELDVKAHEYGFNRDTFEKVLRLRTILEFLIMKFKNCTFFHNNNVLSVVLWINCINLT